MTIHVPTWIVAGIMVGGLLLTILETIATFAVAVFRPSYQPPYKNRAAWFRMGFTWLLVAAGYYLAYVQ